ncbi:NAD-dependent epimerase/dehydratase family protein [Georgenia wangjunii]|uniref:NAD-dependent epimerase/dehydratase family protein n=1 Tax=Georgenia wangjunii TaxID=3117730 RepID=UPI003D9C5FD8
MTSLTLFGATGFVGSAIAAEARLHDHEVSSPSAPRLTYDGDLSGTPRPDTHDPDIERWLEAAVRGSDAVVNAAGIADASAPTSPQLIGANAYWPLLLARACARARVPRLIHISSAAVQGRTTLDETMRSAPFSPYSASKALGERWVASVPGIEVCTLRPTSVHGPERSVSRSVGRLAASRLSSVAGGGVRHTPQVQVRTVAMSVEFLATFPGKLPPVVLTPDERLTTAEFLHLIGGRPPKTIPESVARVLVRLARVSGMAHPAMSANARRLELLWFGQPRTPGWLDTIPHLVAPRSNWEGRA